MKDTGRTRCRIASKRSGPWHGLRRTVAAARGKKVNRLRPQIPQEPDVPPASRRKLFRNHPKPRSFLLPEWEARNTFN
jgi:hypothetical protein